MIKFQSRDLSLTFTVCRKWHGSHQFTLLLSTMWIEKKKMLIRRTDSSFVMLSYSKPSFRSLWINFHKIRPLLLKWFSKLLWRADFQQFGSFPLPLRLELYCAITSSRKPKALRGGKYSRQHALSSLRVWQVRANDKDQRSAVFWGFFFQMTWSFPPKVLLKPLVASCRWSSNISNQG